MRVVGWRAGLAVAMLTTVAASDGQDALDRYRTQMANMPANAGNPQALSNPSMASSIAQWKAVQQTDLLPFDSYANFLLAHPGWPGEAGVRRAAEKQAAGAQPANVVAYFNRFAPQTATGGVRYALALAGVGRRDAAEEAARGAWRKGALSPGDEQTLLDTFGTAMRPEDQDARMDALLWQGQTAAAMRQIVLVGPAHRDLLAARLALRSNAPEAPAFATGENVLWNNDAGFVADRAIWLRDHGSVAASRASLARPHAFGTPPTDATRWLQLLLGQARGAAADGDWQTAYDIARQVDDAFPADTKVGERSYAERDAYTDLVWLGAQATMRHIGRPADAAPLFERYAGGSRSPSVQSRGFYWAGRAMEAASQKDAARGYLGRAAGFRDQFYGQLAGERLGQALTPPPPFAPAPVDAAARTEFDSRQTVQAARFLGQIGDWQDQTMFLRQIAADAHTDADHVLGDELAKSLNRPDLGVMIGRSALANGFSDYSLAGFPTVSVPATEQQDWTIIHAISRQESQFDRQATSRVGARGLMQLMPGTARDTAGKRGLSWDAGMLTASTDYNVQLGDFYFQQLFQRYGSYPLAVAAYNAGPGNVNKWLVANGDPRTGSIDMVDWIEAIPFTETRNYVQRVIENAVVYDLIAPAHSRSQGDARLSWYLGRTGHPG